MALKLPRCPADGRMSEKRHDPWTLLLDGSLSSLLSRPEPEPPNLVISCFVLFRNASASTADANNEMR
jgi:hypothetical protein